jgi:hypothetical protein
MFKTVITVGFTSLLLFFVSACQNDKMTLRELQAYLSQEENGLLKRINTPGVAIEVSYFPKVLVFQNTAGEGFSRQTDSVDYFMARFSSKSSATLTQIDIYGSQLVVGLDTLDAVDAMFVQGANTVSRNFSVMYAFKSFIDRRPYEDKVFLMLDRKYQDSVVEFLVSDINKAQKIKIVN